MGEFAIQVAAGVVGGLLILWVTLWTGRKRSFRAPHNIRTGRLGIQFSQGGEFAPILHRPEYYEVVLRPDPFEVRVPRSAWVENAPRNTLFCAVFPTDKIWSAFEEGIKVGNEFFPGMGFVDQAHGSGRLALSRFPWEDMKSENLQPEDLRTHNAFSFNVVSGLRFNTSTAEYLGFYVSAITSKPSASLKTSGLSAKAVAQDFDAANEIAKGVRFYTLIAIQDGTIPDAFEKIVLVFR